MHLSVDGHLGYFHFLAIIDSPAMNIHIQVFLCGHTCLVLLGIYLGVELLGHVVISLF